MKEIYSFTVNKKVKKQVEEQTDKGKLLKEIEEDTPIRIIFKRPTRAESEEADVVSAVEYSESIRKGILTIPLLERFYGEKGGFLAENYETKRDQLLTKFWKIENDFQALNIKTDKTAEDKKELERLGVEFIKTQDDLQALIAARNNLFQNTAETRAQNKTVFWLVLFLTYIQPEADVEPIPFFESKAEDYDEAFKEKRADYDKKVEEDNDFFFQVVDKMSFFVSLWYMGRASNKEDFKRIEENLNPTAQQEEAVTEEKKEESVPKEESKQPTTSV